MWTVTYPDESALRELSFQAGAAVAFGLMGMARAIQLRTMLRGRVCSCCGGRDDFLLCGPCQHAVQQASDDRSKADG
jgi:hypothetical protein